MERASEAERVGARRRGSLRRAMALAGFLGAVIAQIALLAGCYALLTGTTLLPAATILSGGGAGLLLMALARRTAPPASKAAARGAALEAEAEPQQSIA